MICFSGNEAKFSRPKGPPKGLKGPHHGKASDLVNALPGHLDFKMNHLLETSLGP